MPEASVTAPNGLPANSVGNSTFMFYVEALPASVVVKVGKTVQNKMINATYDVYNSFCDGKI